MSRSSLLALLGARAACEAVPLGLLMVVGSAVLGGRLPFVATWLAVLGALVALAGVAYGFASRRALLAAALLAVATGMAGAALTAGPGIETPLLGARALGGALGAGVVLWRGLSIPANVHAWRPMALDALVATLAIAAGALLAPERDALAFLAIVVGGLAAIGLAIARGTEELLATDRRGAPRTRPAAFSALFVGVGALGVAAAFPHVRAGLEYVGAFLEPFVRTLLVLVVTPFVYLADWLVRALIPLLASVRIQLPLPLPPPAGDPEAEAEYARQLSLQAEAFLRAFLVLVAVLAVAILVARALVVRRALLSSGGRLEREAIPGEGVLRILRGLFGRPREPRAPRPSGSGPAARVRRAYWDLLALAERAGAGWRATAQTPREHLATLVGDQWFPAAAIVSAFERVRYAGRADVREAERVEEAVRHLERALAERA